MMAKCFQCGAELIVFGDKYIHPPNTNCDIDDGLIIVIRDEFLYREWVKKVGTPTKKTILTKWKESIQKIIDDIKKTRKDLRK